MGVVYEATDLESGSRVALKMMSHALIYDHQAVSRFHRETEIADSLDHPHIVRSHAKFTALSTFFIVMEYCDGLPLSQVISLVGRLDEEAARKILGQLAAALEYTHSCNIVHRDLKPGNVFVQWDGCVKLMDFGLARAERNPELTQCGQILGTPRYMPPEQLAGQTVGCEADLFALGCIGYELITAEPLFPGGDIIALLHQHLDWSLPAAAELGPGISEELHRVLQQCLMTEPKERDVRLSEVAQWASPFDMSICREMADEKTAEAMDVPTVFKQDPTQGSGRGATASQ
ncbi:MAG: serine/threonine protein kinase [Planctomycetes bacterium]|nr:serine/threonine protein kinase [Planctomycetota bacterium]